MNKHRRRLYIPIKDLPKGPGGRRLCRNCGQEVPKGRRSVCSDECVHAYLIQSRPAYARRQVFKRDKGVCCQCSIDTEALERTMRSVQSRNDPAMIRNFIEGLSEDWRKVIKQTSERWFSWGHLWEADHVQEVVKGGGCCGLDNFQTLCRPCHKEKTKKLAKERRRI